MASKTMEICDSTSLFGEITVSKADRTIAITQHNVEYNMTESIVLDSKDMAKFVLFLADSTKDHEDESTFKGAELEQ